MVYEGKPVDAPDWKQKEEGQDDPRLNADVIREVELYLSQAARAYSKMGFADPVAAGYFDSVTKNRRSEDAIRIYLYKPRAVNAPYAWYSPGKPCAQPKTSRRIININAHKFATGGDISGQNYQTLAHELFHAIQYASRYHKNRCGFGAWIDEGSADAVGYYLARKLRGIRFKEETRNNQVLKVFGARYYADPLNSPKDTEHGYMTSSLWRYLAEVSYASMSGKPHLGSRPAPENYEYLADIFNEPFTFHPGPDGQLAWFDKRIASHKHIRMNLAKLYPVFTSSFADYMDKRIGPLLGPGGGNREHGWLVQIFKNCIAAGSVGQSKDARMNLTVKPVAARCFKAQVLPGTKNKDVVIQVKHDDKSVLEQLKISLPDGSDVRAPLIWSSRDDKPPHLATWHFPVLNNIGTYIISNVGEQPALTKTAKLELRISTNNWDSSMTNVGPQQSPPRPARNSRQRTLTKKQQQKKIMEQVMRDPVKHLQPVTRVKRKRYNKPVNCEETSLNLNLCGPQLQINLELSPFASQRAVLNPDPMQNMVAGTGTHPGMGGMQVYQLAIQKTSAALESMDASKIRITLPKIDYGYMGSLNNAKIEVNKANSPDRGYVSYGPRVVVDGPSVRPPNGKVTIEEYSHLVLRGTYSANLIDESNPGKDDAPIVAKTITGRFYVASPIEGDKDFAINKEHMKQQAIQSLMQQTPFGTDAIRAMVKQSGVSPQELCDRGFSDEQLKALGFEAGCEGAEQSGTTAAIQQCTCECKLREKEAQDQKCKRKCRKQWRRCKRDASDIPGDLDGQVALCKSALSKRDLTEAQQQQIIDMFRMAPDFQRKEMLKNYWCSGK